MKGEPKLSVERQDVFLPMAANLFVKLIGEKIRKEMKHSWPRKTFSSILYLFENSPVAFESSPIIW